MVVVVVVVIVIVDADAFHSLTCIANCIVFPTIFIRRPVPFCSALFRSVPFLPAVLLQTQQQNGELCVTAVLTLMIFKQIADSVAYPTRS